MCDFTEARLSASTTNATRLMRRRGSRSEAKEKTSSKYRATASLKRESRTGHVGRSEEFRENYAGSIRLRRQHGNETRTNRAGPGTPTAPRGRKSPPAATGGTQLA